MKAALRRNTEVDSVLPANPEAPSSATNRLTDDASSSRDMSPGASAFGPNTPVIRVRGPLRRRRRPDRSTPLGRRRPLPDPSRSGSGDHGWRDGRCLVAGAVLSWLGAIPRRFL